MLESIEAIQVPIIIILLTTYVLLTIAVFAKLAVIKNDISNIKDNAEKDDIKNTTAHGEIWKEIKANLTQISKTRSEVAHLRGKMNGG